MRGSGTGLFVLRLVLSRRGPPARGFSTAVIDREKDRKSAESSWNGSLFPGLKELASKSVSEDNESAIDFLEDEGVEYEAIRGVLPVRTTTTRPIPWPTIFAHPDRDGSATEAGPSTTIRRRFCDPVASLVEEGDLLAARKVHDELRLARVRIQPRTVYLQAARQSLEARDTSEFLFWLQLYPNRPATKNHPGLKSTWEPITAKVITDHPFDHDFIAQYAGVCAKKGVLPAVIHDLIRHITYIAPPEVSGPIIDETLSAYVAHTTSSKSTSDRARLHLHTAESQVTAWKEAYRQAVEAHGWYADQEAREAAEGQGQQQRTLSPTYIPEGVVKLRDRMAFAVDNPPVAMDLVGIIQQLRSRWPAEEEAWFRERFIRPPGLPARQIHPPPEVRAYEWWRAIMIVEGHKTVGNHQGVIDTFQDHFHWFGLPDHPTRRTSTSKHKLLYPRRSIMTAFLPSLLAGMTSYDIVTFHQAYLKQARHLPPILKPDAHVHNIFIRAIAHHGTTDAAMAAIKLIVSHGYDCGSQAMTTVLYALARSSNFDDMFALLEAMERGEHFDVKPDSISPMGFTTARVIPPPMEVTYDWLANIIRKKRRDHEVAEEVMRRKEAYFGESRVGIDEMGAEDLEQSTG